jgi:hypothetical protein
VWLILHGDVERGTMTRPVLGTSLTVALSLLLIPVASLAQGAGVLLTNQSSGRCIDVIGDPGIDNGAGLQLWDCEWSGFSLTTNPTDQLWADPGSDIGVFIQNTLSGRCIDVAGDPGADNGAPLRIWDCEWSGSSLTGNQTDQVWVFRSDGFIQNSLSGRCIDVVGDPGIDNGAGLQLWDCESSGLSLAGNPTDQTWSTGTAAPAG